MLVFGTVDFGHMEDFVLWPDRATLPLVTAMFSLGLQSHLRQLVMHLLKWQYQPSRRQLGHSWESTITLARDEIALVLERNPGLQQHWTRIWRNATAQPGDSPGSKPAPADHLPGYLPLDACAGAG